ncbi:hypothetical protein [unidentified bacterial endosymbiont]|uniref:hypothetical protein n=1 Tax=unidentified bacterial endosymbiont TaxID=2355 RepID=UPI00209F64AD|nr:hypothetical protein [unidentified bacterial endosymbiont]
METPQVVALPNIPMAAFDGLPQGAQISGYDATFSIISSCIGTTSHRYRFTTQNRVANGCSGTDDSTLQFCLYNGDTKLDLATQTAVISTTETNTDIKVTLQRDVNPPQVGTHSVFVTVTIEPE